MKRVEAYEPWFFLFFGVFHLHRIWGLFDRISYAEFWLSVMEGRGIFYYFLMGFCCFCVFWASGRFAEMGAITWWRWIYILGGSYLLFDLFAIAMRWKFWHELLHKMFDVSWKNTGTIAESLENADFLN